MKIFVDPDENGILYGWSSTKHTDTAIEVEVDENHAFFGKAATGHFRYENEEIILDEQRKLRLLKDRKINQLRVKCEEQIYGTRFTATVNGMELEFSCDDNAQKNFDKAHVAFSQGMTSVIPWTAYKGGEVVRVDITPENFYPIYMAHLQHIQGNISLLRDQLQHQVEQAPTIEDINSIKWPEGGVNESSENAM